MPVCTLNNSSFIFHGSDKFYFYIAGYIWGYNYNFFYGDLGQTTEQITYWLSWVPIVGGLTGSFVGGFVSDRIVKKSEPYKRIWVLVISQVCINLRNVSNLINNFFLFSY